jgi:hypothetical protein
VSTLIPVIVAVIAAVTALAGYLVNGRLNRIDSKMKSYAEALAAVEHCKQLPQTIYRLRDSGPETRAQLATMIGEAQESLAFHCSRLDLGPPEVAAAYRKLADKVSAESAAYRRQAFDAPPPGTDAELETFTGRFPSHSDEESRECLREMRKELTFTRPRHKHPSGDD